MHDKSKQFSLNGAPAPKDASPPSRRSIARRNYFCIFNFLFAAVFAFLPFQPCLGMTEGERRAETIATWNNVHAAIEEFANVNRESGLGRYYLQFWTGDLAQYALKNDIPQILKPLLAIYVAEIDHLVTASDAIFYFDPRSGGVRISRHPLTQPAPMWLDANGIEALLSSTQFIWLLSSLSHAMLEKGQAEFPARVLPTVASHIRRWVISNDRIFQVHGWGCTEGMFNHMELLEHKRRFAFTKKQDPSYCNAVTDGDTWIIAAAAELLAVRKEAGLSDTEVAQLRNYVGIATSLLESRSYTIRLSKPDGSETSGLVLDPGAYDTYPDHLFAGYESQTFPTLQDVAPSQSGWDVGHGTRQVSVLLSLYDTRDATHAVWPGADVISAYARTFAFGVFEGDLRRPRLRNFLDGSNGWYQVNIAATRGIRPFGLTHALFMGAWNRYAPFEPAVSDIMAATWRIIASEGAEDLAFRRSAFEESTPKGGIVTERLSPRGKSQWILPLLATMPTTP